LLEYRNSLLDKPQVTVFDKLMYKKYSFSYKVLCLFTLIPPLRKEEWNLYLNKNYILDNQLHINTTKTFPRVINIPDELLKIVVDLFQINNNIGKPIPNFSKKITEVFKVIPELSKSSRPVHILRRIYISTFGTKDSHIMGHTATTATNDYLQPLPEN
jgi:hypothetical protein